MTNDESGMTTIEVTVVFDSICCMQVKIWFQNHRYKTKKAAVAGTEGCTGSKSSSSSQSSARPRCVAVSVLVRDGHPCNSQSQLASHCHLSSDVIVTSRSPPINRVAATSIRHMAAASQFKSIISDGKI